MSNPKIEGCCVSDKKVNFGTWYTPHDKTPEECTYCSYCVEECGCISKDDVYTLGDDITNCNCDCPNRYNHPQYVTIVCPSCSVDFFYNALGTMSCCCLCSTIIRGSDGLNGGLCEKCSFVSNICKKCGVGIDDGAILLECLKEGMQQCKTNLGYHVQEKMDNISETLDKITTDLEELFLDKNHDETIKILKTNNLDKKIGEEIADVVYE